MIALFVKEVRSYVNSFIAYGVIVFFLVSTSSWFFFVHQFLARDVASLRAYFQIMVFAVVLVIPALTMKSWSEERKRGTEELLMTLPFTETELVVGKFLATLTVFMVMIVLTLPVTLLVHLLGDFETGTIVGQYIGIVCLGTSVIAIGQFVSGIGKNQIAVLLGTVAILLFLAVGRYFGSGLELPATFLFLDVHFQSFKRGLLDTRDLVYFLLLTFLFLYLNVKTLRFRKLV
jgi:ABC-2 type transport system permease protein